MAYAEKRNGAPTGRWIGEVEVAGKRLRQRHDTRGEAEAWELRVKAPAVSNVVSIRPVPAASPNLKDFYLEVRDRLWGTSKTKFEIYRLAEDAIDALGNPPVTSITKRELSAAVSKWLAADKGAKRINNLLVPVGRLLAEAEDFFPGYTAPRLPKLDGADRKRSRTVSHQEEALLLAWLRGQGRDVEADLVELLVITGCRVGELLQAQASQIGTDARGAFLALGDHQTKNGEGRKVRLEGRGLEIAKARLPFATNYDVLNRWFNAAKDALGITDPDFVVHALRHTCGTRLLNEHGVDIRVVQQYLGHKSITMTQRYVEVEADALAGAAAAMSRKA